MKTTLQLLLKTTLIVALFLFTAPGCKKDNNPAPSIPPESSFVMDFADFSNPNDTIGSREIASYQNWGYSFSTVVVWQTLINTGLAIPIASFRESFKHEAVYHPDQGNWTWSYNFTANQTVCEAVLTGTLEADSVDWKMNITAGSEFVDVLWYYGKSALDKSGGYWILQENPLDPQPFLLIDWHHNSDGTKAITYRNIKAEAPQNGAYISHGTTLNYFDRFYHVYNKDLDNLTGIEWSSVNKDGHVKDPLHFEDGLWHCWDATLKDIDCP